MYTDFKKMYQEGHIVEYYESDILVLMVKCKIDKTAGIGKYFEFTFSIVNNGIDKLEIMEDSISGNYIGKKSGILEFYNSKEVVKKLKSAQFWADVARGYNAASNSDYTNEMNRRVSSSESDFISNINKGYLKNNTLLINNSYAAYIYAKYVKSDIITMEFILNGSKYLFKWNTVDLTK